MESAQFKELVMCILHSVERLQGFSMTAVDGDLGHVKDMVFDDRQWTIRDLIVDTKGRLPGRNVLISPASLLESDWSHHTLSIGLTKQQVQNGSATDTKKPALHRYDGAMRELMARENVQRDSQLHRCEEVIGCDIQTSDDSIGHVDDLLFDEESWKIELMVVDTRNWWPGKRVVISPRRIVRVSWAAMIVIVDVTRKQIENKEYGLAQSLMAV